MGSEVAAEPDLRLVIHYALDCSQRMKDCLAERLAKQRVMTDGGSKPATDFPSVVLLPQASSVVLIEGCSSASQRSSPDPFPQAGSVLLVVGSLSAPLHPSPDPQRPRKARSRTPLSWAAKLSQAPPVRRAKAGAALRLVRCSLRAAPDCPETRSRSHHLQIGLSPPRTHRQDVVFTPTIGRSQNVDFA